MNSKYIDEVIARINHVVNDTNQKVSDSLFVLEQKELDIDYMLNHDFIMPERYVVDISDDSTFVEAFADYDFINHSSTQGEKNLNFAKALCRVIEASDDYHIKQIASDRSIGSVKMMGKNNNNTLKYEMLGELVRQYATSQPNYAKLTVVSDDIGKDPKSGKPSIVVFVELNLDNKEYWITWHAMDPGNTRKADHKQKGGKFKARARSFDIIKSFNHPSFKKLVKNNKNDDTAEYEALEKKYKSVPANRKGDATHTMLIKAFKLGK